MPVKKKQTIEQEVDKFLSQRSSIEQEVDAFLSQRSASSAPTGSEILPSLNRAHRRAAGMMQSGGALGTPFTLDPLEHIRAAREDREPRQANFPEGPLRDAVEAIESFLQENGLTMTGGMGGALYGAARGARAGSWGAGIGAIVGAAGGGGFGETVNRETQGMYPNEDPLQERWEAFKQGAISEGLGEALMVATGGAGIAGTRLLSRWLPRVTAENRAKAEGIEVMNAMIRDRYADIQPGKWVNIEPPLGMFSDNAFIKFATNWSEGSPFGGQVSDSIQHATDLVQRAFQENANQMATIVAPEELGKVISRQLSGTVDFTPMVSRGLRARAAQIAPDDLMVPTQDLAQTIRQHLSTKEQLELSIMMGKPAGKIGGGEPIPYQTAFEITKALENAALDRSIPETTRIGYTKVLMGFDDGMIKALGTVDRQAAKTVVLSLREGDMRPYIESLIQKGQTTPSELAEQLLKEFQNRPENIRKLKLLMDGTPAWNQLRANSYGWLLKESTNIETGVLDGGKLFSLVKVLHEPGPLPMKDVLKEMFEPDEIADLYSWSKNLADIQEISRSGVGKMAVQLSTQKMISDPNPKTRWLDWITVGYGPWKMGEIMVNPKARALLMRGQLLPRDHPVAHQLTARLTAYLMRYEEANRSRHEQRGWEWIPVEVSEPEPIGIRGLSLNPLQNQP